MLGVQTDLGMGKQAENSVCPSAVYYIVACCESDGDLRILIAL